MHHHASIRRAKRATFAILVALLLPFLVSIFAFVGFNDDTGDNLILLSHGLIQVHHDRNSGGPWRHPPIEWIYQSHEPALAFDAPTWRLRKLPPYFSSTLSSSDPMMLGYTSQWQVILPLWIPLALALPVAIVLWWWDRRLSNTGRCCRCKYDLAGLSEPICPECGSSFASDRHGPPCPAAI